MPSSFLLHAHAKNRQLGGMKAVPQRLPDNTIPFTIDGWRVDALPREMLLRLRKLADHKGSTVADELHDGMALWLAKREAERELPEKIIRFPRPLRGAGNGAR